MYTTLHKMGDCGFTLKTKYLKTSYHGLPKPITCPDGIHRNSMAIYYVSDARESAAKRYKATFVNVHPDHSDNTKLSQLYNIRKTRIITKNDLDTIYPEWETDGMGSW